MLSVIRWSNGASFTGLVMWRINIIEWEIVGVQFFFCKGKGCCRMSPSWALCCKISPMLSTELTVCTGTLMFWSWFDIRLVFLVWPIIMTFVNCHRYALSYGEFCRYIYGMVWYVYNLNIYYTGFNDHYHNCLHLFFHWQLLRMALCLKNKICTASNNWK